MDALAKNGIMGQVISVGKGIAPESDIAVFNMLGYKFQHSDYAGRGVVEAIGIGIDFKDGDLALRGNFATLDTEGKIIDRRAGRKIERKDAEKISKEIEKKNLTDDQKMNLSFGLGKAYEDIKNFDLSFKNYLNGLAVFPVINTLSYGKERPAVVGSNEGAWSQNRRSVTQVN